MKAGAGTPHRLIKDIRGRLKTQTEDDETSLWIAVRTAIDLSCNLDPLNGHLLPVIEKLKPEFKGTFLDVGCYGGWVYPLVRDHVEYKGIDIWGSAIKAARRLFGDRFEQCDFHNYKEVHDIVWATQLHPQYPARYMKMLRPLARRMLIITAQGEEQKSLGADEVIQVAGMSVLIWRFGG